MNPEVDVYLSNAKKWQPEFEKLRMIILDCGLTEELKWGVPCYTFQKSNIALIHVDFEDLGCINRYPENSYNLKMKFCYKHSL